MKLKQVAFSFVLLWLATTASLSAPLFKGMSLPVWQRGGYRTEGFSEALAELRELGANAVALIPTLYQKGSRAGEIVQTEKTVSDEALQEAIERGKKLGFSVLLKPHLDLERGAYRGTISPKVISRWEKSYAKWILHYAALAEKTGTELFAIGTELEAMTARDPDFFRELVQRVRKVFKGKILYAANWTEVERIPFWDALDFIGVDAYYPLDFSGEPTLEELKAAWHRIGRRLQRLSEKVGKRVLFTEAGYTSQDGTARFPWSWTISAFEDQEEQALCYRALLSAFWEETYFAGLFVWEWEFYKTKEEGRLSFTPRGKEAEQVLREYYRK